MNTLSPGSVDHKYAIGENTTIPSSLSGFCNWCVAASEWFCVLRGGGWSSHDNKVWGR